MNETAKRLNEFKLLLHDMEQKHAGIHSWRNLKRAPKAFDLLANQLPMRLEGELTPYVRVLLVGRLLEAMERLSQPRLALQMLHYQSSLLDAIDDAADRPTDMAYDKFVGNPSLYTRSLNCVKEAMRREECRLQDFINPDVPMPVWAKRYANDCMIDPVERTFEWEEHIADVEERVERSLPHPRESHFFPAYGYWERKTEVLREMGIEWKSPDKMNPQLLFD